MLYGGRVVWCAVLVLGGGFQKIYQPDARFARAPTHPVPTALWLTYPEEEAYHKGINFFNQHYFQGIYSSAHTQISFG